MRVAVAIASQTESVWQQAVLADEQQHEERLQADFFKSGCQMLYALRENSYQAVIVAQPGAEGMETVFGIREHSKTIPIVWISDDYAFGPLSYRVCARLFLAGPMTVEQAIKALAECRVKKSEECLG